MQFIFIKKLGILTKVIGVQNAFRYLACSQKDTLIKIEQIKK